MYFPPFTIKHLKEWSTFHFPKCGCPVTQHHLAPNANLSRMPTLKGQQRCLNHQINCLSLSLTFLPNGTRLSPSLGLHTWLIYTNHSFLRWLTYAISCPSFDLHCPVYQSVHLACSRRPLVAACSSIRSAHNAFSVSSGWGRYCVCIVALTAPPLVKCTVMLTKYRWTNTWKD